MVNNKASIFTYSEYRRFLKDLLKGQKTRGLLTRLAVSCRCKPAHLSMVISGRNELSHDQAYAIGRNLSFDERELEYWLLMVQFSRAATHELRAHLQQKLKIMSQEALTVSAVAKKSPPPPEAFAQIYYSSWEYSAIHMLATIPEFQTISALADRLGLAVRRVQEILEFLQRNEMLRLEKDRIVSVQSRIHVANDSSFVSLHHLNWRQRAVEDSMRKPKDSIHYTSVISLSQEDVAQLRAKIMEFIKEKKALVKESPEEQLACFALDFFEL